MFSLTFTSVYLYANYEATVAYVFIMYFEPCQVFILCLCDSLLSVKFMNKIRYVHSLEELEQIIPMEHIHIPECVIQ